MLHKIIEIGLAMSGDGVRIEEVVSARIRMPKGGALPLIHAHPTSGRQAQFSGQYALLAALADGDITSETFTDAAVARPEIKARLDQVALIEEDAELIRSEQLVDAPVVVNVT